MAQTKIKAGLFEGIIGNGADGYFLMSNGDGTMTWTAIVINPTIASIAYPGSATAADPAGGETITVTGTDFKTGATVTIGGTAAPAVSYVSATQITFTTPAKAAGDYDIVVTNTDTGSATYINGISYNGIPTWTTAAGSLGTFASGATISTITLQATEPDAGTITFNITNGALPTGLSLTGANIDGTTTLETADTLYTFTVTATDDESQATPRTFTITVTKQFISTENFTINTYTGNGSTQSIEGKIGTASSFALSNSYIIAGSGLYESARGTNGTSVSFWMQSRANNYVTPIYTRTSSAAAGWHIRTSTGGNGINWGWQNSSGGVVFASGEETVTLTDGWHHIVAIWDGTTNANGAKLYIDGSLFGELTANATLASQTFSLEPTLGNDRQSGGRGLKGLDQVRFFNKALSSSEVTTLYGENNTSTTKSTTDIFDDGSGVALYEFEEGAKDTGGVTGYIGDGGIFNGSSSRITTNLITPNTQDLSWSFWVKDLVHNGSSSMNTLLLDYKNNYAFINYTSSNTIYANARSSSTNANIYVQSSAIDTSSWRHIVFVSSLSSGSFLYIDGALVDSNTASMPSRSNLNYGSGLEIGWNPAEGSPFTSYALDGKIDQVRIFNKALSSSEVTTLYGENNTSTTKSTTDIFDDGSGVALYELDEDANGTAPSETLVETNQLINLRAENYTSGSTWTDISGQNNNATLTNPTKPTTESVHFDYANLGAQNQYGGNNVSIEFFIKTTNTDDDYFLTAYNGGGLIPGEFLLYMPLSSANSKPYLTVSGSTSSASNLSFDHTVVQNDWTHYVLVYDSSLTGNTNRFIMYVNGVEVTTSVEGGVDNFDNSNFMGDTSTLFIGKRGGGTDYEEMDIKEFRIYSKSLSSQEVAQNYAASAFKYNGTPTNINFLGMAFQPDLVWIKDRDNSNPHELSDSVRGVSGTLNTNATNAEYINASFQITSLDTNGFTVVDDSAGNYAVNGNGIDYVAWCWKAADTTTTISAGTVGNTIASDVRANTEAGFSIVSFTSNGAASVVSTGHGLSVEPEMVIFKNRDNSSYWLTYHKDIGDNGYLALQDTFGTQSFTPFFDMTSTTIAVRQSSLASNNEKCIAYCFHSVDGYQKVGSYTGNRPTDVVIDTGFAPRFVMIKCDASGESWTILDSARGDNLLHPNTSGTEQSYTGVSLTSTGFTVHDSGLSNTNGATHIYLAIA